MEIQLPLILIVEDNNEARELLARLLGRFGYRTAKAANGREALAAYRDAIENGEISIILTDVDMPVMDGIALTAEVRTLRAGLPILFMTGAAGRPELIGERVLAKPVSATKVVEAIKQLLTPLGSIPPPSGPLGAA